MKKSYLLMAVAAIALVFASCEKENKTFNENNLYGYWQESEPGSQEFVRFLKATEDTVDGDYKFGYEFDEGDEVFEDDLLYHGNGWFKWKLIQADLTTIALMDNGSADIPKLYIVKELTETNLVLQDKEDKDDIEYFQKVSRKPYDFKK